VLSGALDEGENEAAPHEEEAPAKPERTKAEQRSAPQDYAAAKGKRRKRTDDEEPIPF
jgi:hypothetical protein